MNRRTILRLPRDRTKRHTRLPDSSMQHKDKYILLRSEVILRKNTLECQVTR